MTNFISEIDKSWTLFLDRDGVINKRIYGGYVTSWDELEFLPGVVEAISIFSGLFKYIFIVTNQQGVGKGLMNIDQLNSIHEDMIKEISLEGGVINKVYFCTDLADTPDNCRKPGVFMAEKAKEDFPDIDFGKSIMIGDSDSDIMFGRNAGMKTILHKSEEIVTIDADFKVDSLLEFAEMLRNFDNEG